MIRALCVCLVIALSASAQEPAPTKVDTLRTLIESISSIRTQLNQQNTLAKSGETEAIKEAAKAEAAKLQKSLTEAMQQFEFVATDVDRRAAAQPPSTKLDLMAELNELLAPLMQELKQVTEQPRVIEGLRAEVSYQERQLTEANKALEHIAALLKAVPKGKDNSTEAALRQALVESQKRWTANVQETKGALGATQHRLSETLTNRKSLWEIITQAARGFFLTRGLSMVLAAITFFAAFLGWRSMHRWVVKLSPWHRGAEKPFFARVLDVLYHATAFIVATIAALTVLYSVGDWLLLGLSLIALLALILAAKNGLPRYYTQARLLLNLGEVREGERIVHHGLPWEVRTLNLVTELVNPALEHGVLRVPIAQLAMLSSRRVAANELWFPCVVGDWVQLGDGTFGKVVVLNSEFVQIVQLGGSHRTYTTQAFLGQNAINLTGGFRVNAIVKVHPEHRALATSGIPEALRDGIHEGLLSLAEPQQIKSLKVEFRAVIPNAMEYDVTADFAGELAEKHPTLQRALQHHALAVCNTRGWKLGG